MCAALAFLWSWLFETTFFVGPVVALMLLLALPVLVIYLAHGGHMRAFLGLVGGLAVVLFLPIGAAGHWFWSWISLQQHQHAYVQIVAEPNDLPDAGIHLGERYIVGRGEPLRVAFPRAEGIPDSWSAVVYDPSEDIDAVKRRAIFTNQAQRCIRITGPWYRCWFD